MHHQVRHLAAANRAGDLSAVTGLATLARQLTPGTDGGDAARVALLNALGTTEPDVRRAALRGLRRLADPTTAGAVVAALGDPVPGVRLAAVHALDTMPAEVAAPELVRLLSDDSLTSDVIDTLGTLVERQPAARDRVTAAAVALVGGEAPEHGVRLLRRLRAAGAAELMLTLVHDERPSVRHAAARALRSLAPDRVDVALALLDSEPDCCGLLATGWLADRGGPEHVPVLAARLADPDPWVLYHAVRGLGRIGDPAALGHLRVLLAADPPSEVWCRVATHLCQRPEPADLRFAVPALAHRHKNVRIVAVCLAAEVVAAHGPPADTAELARLLPDLRAELSRLSPVLERALTRLADAVPSTEPDG